MASRVNTRFVIILAVVLLALVGVTAYVGSRAMLKSSEDLVKLGDDAMKAQDYEKAASMYGRAVNKDQRNAAWIKRWIDAIEKLTPKTRQAYSDVYGSQYLTALRAMCDSDRTEPKVFERYLEERFQLAILTGRLADWESFQKQIDEAMKSYQGSEDGKKRLLRFRGLATSGLMSVNPDLNEDALRAGLKSLDDALAVNANDWRSVLAASDLEVALAEIARKRDDQQGKNQMMTAARARLTKFAGDYPPAPNAKFRLLVLDMADAARAYAEAKPSSKEPFPGPALLKARDDRMKEIVEGMRSMKAEDMDPRFTLNIAAAAMEAFPTEGVAIATEIIEKARQGNPKDVAELTIGEGLLAGSRGRNDEAEKLFRRVADMPDVPMSLQGVRLTSDRARALQLLSELYFGQWRDAAAAGDPNKADEVKAKQEAFRTKFEGVRNDLVARVGEADLNVMALDARLLLMKGDVQGARVKVTQYNDQSDRRNTSMLLLEGDILRRTGNFGGAKQVYARVFEIDPRNMDAIMGMVDIEQRMANVNEMVRWLTMAAALQPKNESIEKMLKDARALAGQAADDPVMKAVAEAQGKVEGLGRDLPGAIKILQDALKQRAGEPRLSAVLANLLSANGQREEARQVIKDALAANPGDQRLKAMEKALASDDPMQAQLDMIGAAPGLSDLQKTLERFQVYTRFNKKEDAAKELDAAKKMAPEDRVVVEMLFVDAINRNDKAEIDRLSSLAEKKNLDQMDGMLFRARKEIVEKRFDDALKTLRDAVAKDRFNVLSWRLLGMVNFQKADYAAASDALKKAVEINNTDIPTIKTYMRSLILQNRYPEALDIGRKSERLAGGESDFAELLLKLEAEAPGGDRARAIAARQSLLQRQPDNDQNKIELGKLLVNEKKFAEAKKLVDDFRAAKPMDPQGVELDAGLNAAQGRMADTKRIFEEYVNKLPEGERTPTPYISCGRMLASIGQVDAAEAMLESGRKYQSPKDMVIDRELGDLMYNSQQYDKSITVYQRILDAKLPDDDMRVTKRVMEANLRLKKFAEVDKLLEAQGGEAKKDLAMLLLGAEAAAGQGQRDRARQLYDDAVRLFPKNPMVFLKRGDFNRADPALTKDARQDYEQMLRIDPANVIAMVRLGNLLREAGDIEGALQNFKKAVDAEPDDDQLRSAYIDLLMQRGKRDEAVSSVEQIVAMQPNNAAWLARGAELMMRLGRPDKASDYLKKVWGFRPSPEVGLFYLNALLSMDPPDLVTAQEVLVNPATKTDEIVALRLAKARWYRLQRKMKEASDEVLSSYAMVDHAKRDQAMQLVNGMEAIYPKTPELLTALSALEQKKPFAQWTKFQVSMVRMRDPALRSSVVSDLRELGGSSQDSSLKARSWSVVGGTEYDAQQWESAVSSFRKGLEAEPNNAELNNNVAFTLATKLNKPDEALEFAEKAVKAAPNNSGFLDTLAAVHIGKKNWNKASEYLAQAISVASSDAERAPVFLHLARVQLEKGDKAGARRLLRQADDIVQAIPQLRSAYETDVKDLGKAIDGL